MFRLSINQTLLFFLKGIFPKVKPIVKDAKQSMQNN